jgi:hypothetical protein
MNVTNKFPDYNFKVSTEGFDKEQLQAAYKWIKECAVKRGLRYHNLRTDKEYRYYIGVLVSLNGILVSMMPSQIYQKSS